MLRVPSLRALMIGSAISSGALAGFGFWAAAFYERHTSFGTGGAGSVVGAVILVGAVVGTILGGRAADRARGRDPSAPMRLAAMTQSIAAVIFVPSFLPVPLAVRLPMQIVAVAFVVAAFPALSSMISEVVPATIRGIAFSVSGFLGALVSAASPLLIGAIADQFPIMVDGRMRGNLAIAFACVTPLILVGAVVVMNGRRHVAADIARVRGVDLSRLVRAETARADERSYPMTTVVRILITGAFLVLATVGLVVAAGGGELRHVLDAGWRARDRGHLGRLRLPARALARDPDRHGS